MKKIQIFGWLILTLASRSVLAQEGTVADLSAATNTVPVLTEEEDGKDWSFSASASLYLVPGSREYVQPTVMADLEGVHLEARYNYEALDTGSLWIGYNFSFGDKVSFEFTPMFGAFFGDSNGLALGYRYTLSWWKLELYSEGEYAFSNAGSSENFFYTWSELSLAPVDWFRFGLAVQRTKVYQTEFDLQHGFLVGFSYGKLDFTTYVFNPEASRPLIVLALGIGF